ncbi:MAG: hypothetical protein ACEQSK_15145, partial [Sphingomonadaceae bacterium]
MHGDTELKRRLWSAILRRRMPHWLAVLLPLLAAALLPAPRAAALAAIGIWAIWLALDARRCRQRLNTHWSAWLDAAVPALEDSSALLAIAAGSAATPVARLQQQRLLARLAAALNTDDYRAIARTRVRFALLPLIVSLCAGAVAWGWHSRHGAAPGASTPAAAGPRKPIVDGEIYLRVK